MWKPGANGRWPGRKEPPRRAVVQARLRRPQAGAQAWRRCRGGGAGGGGRRSAREQLRPWHEALATGRRSDDRPAAHPGPLRQATYGADHGRQTWRRPGGCWRRRRRGRPERRASDLVAAYRRSFPRHDLQRLQAAHPGVMAGETRLLLDEEPSAGPSPEGPWRANPSSSHDSYDLRMR